MIDHTGQAAPEDLPPRLRSAVHQLWDDLADTAGGGGLSALDHLLSVLAELTRAQNAWWMGSVRIGETKPADPYRGWRPAAIHYLHETPNDRAFFREGRRLMDAAGVDESIQANASGAGTFRINWLPEMVSPEWYGSAFHQKAYVEREIHDAVFVGCPVSDGAEVMVGLQRKDESLGRFDAGDRAVFAEAMRGLRWFQRQMLLEHGLLVARWPMTDAERRVVDHLLRGLSESAIARTLQIARPTLHNHVTNIYRKFGVGSRAELMALWLGRTGDAVNPPAPPR